MYNYFEIVVSQSAKWRKYSNSMFLMTRTSSIIKYTQTVAVNSLIKCWTSKPVVIVRLKYYYLQEHRKNYVSGRFSRRLLLMQYHKLNSLEGDFHLHCLSVLSIMKTDDQIHVTKWIESEATKQSIQFLSKRNKKKTEHHAHKRDQH